MRFDGKIFVDLGLRFAARCVRVCAFAKGYMGEFLCEGVVWFDVTFRNSLYILLHGSFYPVITRVFNT